MVSKLPMFRLSAIGRAGRALALLAAPLVLASCDDPEPIKVGFIGGLTGRSADTGEASRNALQLAVEQLNADGGLNGHRIDLVVRDDKDDPETAASAVRYLHAADVVAIIGPNNSSIAAGMLPVLNELETVAISPTVSSLTLAGLDDYLFRINWTTQDNARLYAAEYAGRGILTVAATIDANNRVFSQSWLDEFAETYQGLGGQVVQADAFDADTDEGYSATARRLVASRADAILLVANSVDAAQLAQQVRKLDDQTLLIAAEWAGSERLLTLGGGAIEGLELVQSYDRTDRSPRYVAFRDAYRQRFNQEPGFSSVAAHDAATMLFSALRARSGDQPLRAALIEVGTVQGLQQEVRFDRFGDAQRQAFFVVVRDGQFVVK